MNLQFESWRYLGPVFLALPTVLMAQEGPSDDSTRDAGQTVSVRSFGQDKVIGFLEHPLGTVVRVQGIAIDGGTTRRRIDAGKTLLKIESVNGDKLERSITFPFMAAAREISKPQPGERFDYYVHEYGEFSGTVEIPEELGIERVEIANDGFHYRRLIAIHKDLAKHPH